MESAIYYKIQKSPIMFLSNTKKQETLLMYMFPCAWACIFSTKKELFSLVKTFFLLFFFHYNERRGTTKQIIKQKTLLFT